MTHDLYNVATSADADDNELLASVFEERAEFLSRQELLQWTAETPRDREVLEKLKGAGAKLLVPDLREDTVLAFWTRHFNDALKWYRAHPSRTIL